MNIAKVQQQLLQQRMGIQCEQLETTGPATQRAATAVSTKPSSSSSSSSNLPTDDDIAAHREKYAKWFQMLRFGIAREVVELAMQREHIDPAELDGPHHVVVLNTTANTNVATAKVQDSNHHSTLVVAPLPPKKLIRKRLHWQPKVNLVPTSAPCIWKSSPDTVQISKESAKLMDALFEKPVVEQPANQREISDSKLRKTTRFIALIESKKAQNVAITLARVPLSFPALVKELVNMNPSVLSSAQLQSLLDMWPDQNEWKAIREYTGDITRLGTVSPTASIRLLVYCAVDISFLSFQQAEQFFVHAGQVPRFRDKVTCLIFKQEFPARVFELREAATLLIRGTNQVCSSAALQRMFQYILKSGNLLNIRASSTDAASTNVHGFGLSSLAKLAQTKAFVGGITFAQYLVQCIERDCPDAVHFPKEIHLIASCSKVSIPSLLAEKESLDAGWKALVLEAQIGLEGAELDVLESSILQHFAYEVETELLAAQLHLDQLLESKARFVEYFHEHDAQEELDVLLSYLAQFTEEFALEHKRRQETTQLIADAIASTNGGKRQSAAQTHAPTSCA
uniref:FH2 domain-containing protein n=1 Tax=Globisporangium ultimum (strain ATCC 200006 / CBS 805.95 / DAOM BR144) TaxID=431595 RepID=K3X791_GLOUD